MLRSISLPSGFALAFLCLFSCGAASGQHQIPKKTYTTQRISTTPPVIDGFGHDPAWEQVEWGTDFTQRQPADGEKPTAQTAFKILYDEKNFYMLIRAYDDEPNKIVRRMSRRDGFEGDWVEVNIDSYFDQRSAFSFTTSVSGVKGDEAISNNGNQWDASWDPIWYLKTSVDEKGWISECRIPLTQLRFGDKEKHVWGIQVTRRNFRKEEISNWQYIPQNAPGWVHLFGELHGITGIKSQKQLEIQPYAVGQLERYPAEPGNPFATGKSSKVTVGLDGKIGITSDITLDFTVNPDFGQVEADPSQVNLSAFEVFFREQRPFFVESNNILNYQITSSVVANQYNTDNLFYSRRIGRSPHHTPEARENEYVQQPQNSSILGALKLTGKTKRGFSFGIMQSLTSREHATLDYQQSRREVSVEPLTNFFVGRAQQDFNKGNTIVGGIFTATHRDITEPQFNNLHRAAYSGGVDFVHNWKDRNYFASGNVIFSHVLGSAEAIVTTQRAQQRFFQRPNAGHLSVDSSRTSLTGTGGTFKIGKRGGSNLRFEGGITWRSPSLDLNDIGFLRSADQINQWLWVGYQVVKPFSIYRNFFVNLGQSRNWDFGGVSTSNTLNLDFRTQFKNYWWIGSNLTTSLGSISNADLRGGPSLRYPGGWGLGYFVESDNRKKLQVSFEHGNSWGNRKSVREVNFSLGITYRPFNSLQISASPSYGLNYTVMQYVTSTNFGSDPRYVVASLNQHTLGMSLRINYILTPNLSIQYYGQPFASQGKYSDFKRITESKAENLEDRFHTFTADQIRYDAANGLYDIDENQDGTSDYRFSNPNFDFVQFRSNLVVRWEYIPGSTLFLVWSQGRTGYPSIDRFSLNEVSRDLFNIEAHNIFLIKYTYRFVR
jgi:hypothetical protein